MSNDNSSSEDNFVTRERGILSQADREYLLGRKDLSDQSERDARYRIRKRIENGLKDMSILSSHLGKSDREQVFEKVSPINLIDTIQLLHSGLYEQTQDFDNTIEILESVIKQGIYWSLVELDSDHVIETVTVDISVDRRPVQLEDLKARFAEGEESHDEFRYLLRHSDLRESLDQDELTLRSFEHLHRRGILDQTISGGENEEKEIDPTNYDDTSEFISDLKDFFEMES